jgi:hypothetical protein
MFILRGVVMFDTVVGEYIQSHPFVLVAVIILMLAFMTAYYLVRKSLQPTENFDPNMLGSLTREDREESLGYCISFFSEAYESRSLPIMTEFMELRIRAAIVFTFFRKSGTAAEVFIKLRNHYLKNKPLPDYTARYQDRLAEDGREGDVTGAFCLHGCELFSQLMEEE